jgi:Holliday junction resolvase-like predicted endonuclease
MKMRNGTLERDMKAMDDRRIKRMEAKVREDKEYLKQLEGMHQKLEVIVVDAKEKYDKIISIFKEKYDKMSEDTKEKHDMAVRYVEESGERIEELKVEIAKGETDIIKMKEKLERR